MIMDLGNDHGTDERTGIGAVESARGLSDEVIIALAIHVATKSNAGIGSAKIKALPVTGQESAVAREEIDAVAIGAEAEAIRVSGIAVESRFQERHVAAGGNRRSGRDD